MFILWNTTHNLHYICYLYDLITTTTTAQHNTV